MLKTLKLICSAADDQDANQAFLRFNKGIVGAYNDLYAIVAPINIPIEVSPHAATLLDALNNAGEGATFTEMKSGKLKVSAGQYKAFVNCNPKALAIPLRPNGDIYEINGEMLRNTFQLLHKLCAAEKLARPWATGVMLRNGCAEATNNRILIQHWMDGFKMPQSIVVPAEVCKLIASMKDLTCLSLQTDGRTVTFTFQEGVQIVSRLIDSTAWMNTQKVLDAHKDDAVYRPLPVDFFKALKKTAAFLGREGFIYLTSNTISTSQNEDGATVEVEGLEHVKLAVFSYSDLLLLDGIVDNIAFDMWPNNVLFKGGKHRGIISSIRV